MKHTPTPWFVSEGCILTKDLPLSNCRPQDLVPLQENAPFIVKACNAHEELLEACKAAYGCRKGNHGMLKQAIANAEGGGA